MSQTDPTKPELPAERKLYESPRVLEDLPLEHMALMCAKLSGPCNPPPNRRT